MFYSRFSRVLKGGLFVFTCALFLKRGTSLLIIGLMMIMILPIPQAKAATADITIDCTATPNIQDGTDFNDSGPDNLTLQNGTCTLVTTNITESENGSDDNYIILNSLWIDGDATLTVTGTGTTASQHNEIDFRVANNVTIDGNINVDGLGYQTEYTVGNTKTGGAGLAGAGGSHGGRGGNGSYTAAVPDSYGSVDNPSLPGGGGGRAVSGYGEDGGGVIRITSTSGTIAVNNDISANGNDSPGYEKGGGAGGSIYLKAGTITLASGKTISANGGDDDASVRDGAGGGGRVTLEYTTFTNSGGTITAYGGDASEADEDGSAGTVYYNDTDGDQDLYITPFSGSETDYATELDADSDGVFDNVFLSNNARLYLHSDATAFSTSYINVPTGSLFESDADLSFPSIDTTTLFLDGGIAKFDGALTLTALDAGTAETGTLITNGTTYITSGAPVIGYGFTWEANSDTIKQSSGTDLTSLTINSGGNVTHSGDTKNTLYDLELTLSGALSVNGTGTVSVDGKGYLGGYDSAPFYHNGYYITGDYDCGDGLCDYNGYSRTGLTEGFAGGSYQSGGGSHGGRGGQWSSEAVADVFDSISNPIYPGGGGGGNNIGGTGGGVIRITADTVSVAGTASITAKGDDSIDYEDGAGAGGTVYLNASTITNGGVIAANGGDDSPAASRDCSGGGGRVALIYPTGGLTDTGTISAYGGDGDNDGEDGAAGTIYHLINGTTKNLYIDANSNTQMRFATEMDEDVDESFNNIYLSNNARLFLNSNASAFSTTLLEIPTGTYFESDRDIIFSKIDTTSLYLNGGTAKFDAGLTLSDGTAGFDTDDDDAETGTLITNGTTYITSGDVDMGSGFTWEANTASSILNGTLSGGEGTITVNSTLGFPEGGTIYLEIEADTDIECTGSTGTTFTGCSNVGAHADNTLIESISPIEKSSGVSLDTLDVTSGATLTSSAATKANFYGLELAIGTLTLDAGGSIHTNDKGFLGGYDTAPFYEDGVYYSQDYDCADGLCDWNGYNGQGMAVDFTFSACNSTCGGSHGGRGGVWSSNVAGGVYDSVSNPIYPGGGGSSNGVTGAGGGLIRIVADTITLNDDITADGGLGGGYYDGAGGGGTVYLNATTSITLANGKKITANGGDDTSGGRDGGGGGGRVALVSPIIINNNLGGSLNLNITAHGGDGTAGDNDDGAAGTLFWHDTDNTYGDLYIENCSTCTTPQYHTSLADTVPADDQVVAYGNGYVYENTTTSQSGVLNISSAIEGGTRQFHCNNCTPVDDNSLANGEIVSDTELFSGGLTANYTCVGTNATPTASITSVTKRTDGSGIADIIIVLGDADIGDTLTAKVEYSVGVGCGGGSDPALDETPANVSGSQGTPVVENDDVYQISSVTVAGGANTVQFDWDSATDIPSGDGTYCLIVTPNDGTTDGTPATKTYPADNVDPSGLTELRADGRTTLSILLGWTDVTETNFDHYEIWYGLSQVDVQGRTGTAAEWDNTTDDLDLGTIGTTDTEIDGLSPNIGNFFKIWAVDTFGNEETVTDIQAYTDANTPGAPTVIASASDALNVVIDENSNPSTTEYAIKVGALYVQANGTLGASEVWQTYTTWGGAVGVDATGLTSNTSYDASVKARNGDSYETSLSTQSSKYTHAAPVTGVSLAEASGGMDLSWTDAGQTGLEIYLAIADGSVCDSVYDMLKYDDSDTNPDSPLSYGASTGYCYRMRIGSYNDAGVLNTAEYAFSGDLTVDSDGGSTSGGSSGGSSTAFYSLLSNVSRSEKIAIDIAEKEELLEKVEEEEDKEEEKEKEKDKEEELKKPVFEFDKEFAKEPIKYFRPLELVYDKYDFDVYERKLPKFKLASELDFKYMKLEPIVLEKSLKEYFEDEKMKKELFKDVVEDFAEEFLEDDFVEEFLEELKEEEEEKEKAEEEAEKGEEELDLVEATDEVLEEILGEDMEDIDVFEPELEVDDDAEEGLVEDVEEEDVEEEVELEEEKTELEKEVEFEEEAVEILEELTVEEIVTSGVSEVVEASITGSVRAAIEVGDAVEVHTDKGVYVVENVEDIVAIIEELDEDELEKVDLDNDGMNDIVQMNRGLPLFNSDPDGDGIPTSVEVYCGWDALNMDSLDDNLANTKVANLQGNTFGNVPAIRACGGEGSLVDVVLFDVGEVFGDEKFESEEELTDKLVVGMRNADQQYAGSMMMDESNQGVLLPLDEIEDGKYIVMLTGEDGVEHLSTLSVKNDKVPAAAEMRIGSKGLRLGFVTGNTLYLSERSVAGFNVDSYIGSFPGAAVPVITGQIADFESLTVVATWKSITYSSTAFTDAGDGSFELEIPDNLPSGAHDIIVYLQNENDDLVSSATVLQFMK